MSNVRALSAARWAIGLVVMGACSAALAQPTFSVDFQGPPKGFPDFMFGFPITEGDILMPPFGVPAIGPLPPPAIFISAGFGPPAPGLALPMWPGAIGLPPGVPGFVELDALAYGTDFPVSPAFPPNQLMWFFSVDEWAVGLFGSPAPPAVWTEGAAGTMEASADVFRSIGLPPGPIPPPPVFGNTEVIDGNGIAPPGTPGMGLMEPNPPIVGLPDPGTNLDALDMDTTPMVFPYPGPVYYSLDSGIVFDFYDGFPGTASAAANGGFSGGDMLVCFGPGAPPVVWAPAFMLGLDIMGPDTDDLDALIYWDNGDGMYTPPAGPYSWLGGGTDMVFFSVRRGSAIIGSPDFFFGAPIEPGDILMPPPGPGAPPGIWMPAEAFGLLTARTGSPVVDDLDALDVVRCVPCDINADGSINGFDIDPFVALLTGIGVPIYPCSGDMNGDGSVNGFDIDPFVTALTVGGC